MPRRLLALRRLILMARVAVLVSLGLFVANLFLGRARHDVMGRPIMGDFIAHYTGGHFAGTAELYSIDAQRAFQHGLLGDEGYLNLFISPPWVAFLYAPFARLPLAIAQWLWAAIIVASFAVGWRLLRAHTGPTKRHERRLLLLFSLAFFPVVDLMGSGQDTCLTGLVWALGIHLALGRRDFLAGIVFGLGALKPQLFVLPIVYLLVTKRFSAVVGAAVSAGACVGLALATGGTTVFRSWLAILQSPEYVEATRRAGVWKMQSIVATVEGVFPFSLDHVARPIGFAIASLVGIVTIARARRMNEPRHVWALLVVGSVLVSPHLFGYDLALLVIPAALLLSDRWERSTVQAIVAMDVVLWFAVQRSTFAVREWPISMLAAPLVPLGLLVLWRDIWRMPRTRPA